MWFERLWPLYNLQWTASTSILISGSIPTPFCMSVHLRLRHDCLTSFTERCTHSWRDEWLRLWLVKSVIYFSVKFSFTFTSHHEKARIGSARRDLTPAQMIWILYSLKVKYLLWLQLDQQQHAAWTVCLLWVLWDGRGDHCCSTRRVTRIHALPKCL